MVTSSGKDTESHRLTSTAGAGPAGTTSLLSRLDSPLAPLAVTAAVFFVFLFASLARHGYNPGYFVMAGRNFTDARALPPGIPVVTPDGYDGQFYYRLALDPFTNKQTDHGIRLDNPMWRQQRIGYPLTVWALSLGRAELVPAMMLFVNYAALCLMGWMGGLYARSLGRHALWGLALPFYPGFLITLSRNTTEILQVCLLLGSFVLLRRSRFVGAALLLGMAALTKETSLLVAAAALLIYLFEVWQRKERKTFPAYYVIVPFAMQLAMQFVQLQVWGTLPFLAGSNNLGVPFLGFFSYFLPTTAFSHVGHRWWFTELLFLLVFGLCALGALRTSAASAHEKLSWLLYAAMMAVLTRVWIDDAGFFRATAEYYVLGAMLLLGARFPVKAPVLAASAVLWLALAQNTIRNG